MIDIPIEGTCVTRNGRFRVSRMKAGLNEVDTGIADVKFVSSRLCRVLRAGHSIRAVDLDNFCLEWLRYRGCIDRGVVGVDKVRKLKQLAKELTLLLDGI